MLIVLVLVHWDVVLGLLAITGYLQDDIHKVWHGISWEQTERIFFVYTARVLEKIFETEQDKLFNSDHYLQEIW